MNTPSPHPLAVLLIERLAGVPDAAVIDFGAGKGRNTAAFVAAGLNVCAVPDAQIRSFAPERRFDAALSTHALLHGTRSDAEAMLRALNGALEPGAPLYATFASKRDARYGVGTPLETDVFAPDSGDEAGVAHVYFDEAQLRALIEPYFIIDSMHERNVDRIVGQWAHQRVPEGTVHWIVHARRR